MTTNGWLKFKAERHALLNKEAARAKIRLDRLEARIDAVALKRAAQREERELRALERKQAIAEKKVPAEIPSDLLVLAHEGHLPGFVAVNPHSETGHEMNYAEWLEERYLLHLPPGAPSLRGEYVGFTALRSLHENIFQE